MSRVFNIMYRDANGRQEIGGEAALLGKRKITLYGEITMEAAEEAVGKILCLCDVDAHQPIHILLNSGGGSIEAGMLLYDAIQTSPAPVKLYCMGYAFSMAAVLLAAGEHGRYILPHGRVMIHEPSVGTNITGDSHSLQNISDALLKIKTDMENLLAKHTGKSPKEIAMATQIEHYFTAEEALDFGIVDKIIGLKDIGNF